MRLNRREKIYRTLESISALIVFCFAFSLGLSAHAAWLGPTNLPPLDNVPAPLNMGTIFGGFDSDLVGASNVIGKYNNLKISISPCSNGQVLMWSTSTFPTSGHVYCGEPVLKVGLLQVLQFNSDASGYTGGAVIGSTTASWLNLGGALTVGWLHTTQTGNNSIAGNLGIGTSFPNAALHVASTTGNAEIDIQSITGSGNHWAVYHDADTNDLRFWQGSDRMEIAGNGVVTASDFCTLTGKCLKDTALTSFAGLATSTNNYDGDQGGYVGMNNICRAKFANSHMCTSDEMLTIARTPSQLSGADGHAWISGGVSGFRNGDLVNDCQGWTGTTGSSGEYYFGTIWRFIGASSNGGSPWLGQCNDAWPVACCK